MSTPDEIRSMKLEPTCDVTVDQVAPMVADCAYFLREIAAQLSELNQNMRCMADRMPTGSDE